MTLHGKSGDMLIVDDPSFEEFLADLLSRLTLEQQLCLEFGFRHVYIKRDAACRSIVIDVDRHAHRQRVMIADELVAHSRLTWPQLARLQCQRMANEMAEDGTRRTPLDQLDGGRLAAVLGALSWDRQRDLEHHFRLQSIPPRYLASGAHLYTKELSAVLSEQLKNDDDQRAAPKDKSPVPRWARDRKAKPSRPGR